MVDLDMARLSCNSTNFSLARVHLTPGTLAFLISAR